MGLSTRDLSQDESRNSDANSLTKLFVIPSEVEEPRGTSSDALRGPSTSRRSARDDPNNQTLSSLKCRLPFRALAYSSLLRIFSSSCISVRQKFLKNPSTRSWLLMTSSVR